MLVPGGCSWLTGSSMLHVRTSTKRSLFGPSYRILLFEVIRIGIMRVHGIAGLNEECRARKWTTAIAGHCKKDVSGGSCVSRPRRLTSLNQGTPNPVMVRTISPKRLWGIVIPCGAPRNGNVWRQWPRAKTLFC